MANQCCCWQESRFLATRTLPPQGCLSVWQRVAAPCPNLINRPLSHSFSYTQAHTSNTRKHARRHARTHAHTSRASHPRQQDENHNSIISGCLCFSGKVSDLAWIRGGKLFSVHPLCPEKAATFRALTLRVRQKE